MKANLEMIAFGLGCGIGAATVQDIVHWGLDGLSILGIVGCSLLVYYGGKGLME